MTTPNCFSQETTGTALFLITPEQYPAFLTRQSDATTAWLSANHFNAHANQYCLIPDAQGQIACVCVGFNPDSQLYTLSDLPLKLPQGSYYLANSEDFSANTLYLLSLGWGLGAYQFTRYKKAKRQAAKWIVPKSIDQVRLEHELEASFWVRDLINTPAEDMMPEHLAAEAEDLSRRFFGDYRCIIGDALLTENYPMIHAVGRASTHSPRLIELSFGATHLPKLTLVGKGVCFDSGGLDLKPASGMLTMKKDMGGAAHVLGLAQLILAQKLPVHLRVLIPAVDNAVSGNAFRPGDILSTRLGVTVEIGNTDAEGRLVLGDALTAAIEQSPDMVIDFATLTGAARVAVGTDIAAYFSNNEALASSMQQAADAIEDPSWRLPLFKPYRKLFQSHLADLNNSPNNPYAGAITAALFLQSFVPDSTPWLHFDIMAFNPKSSPGKAEGGESMGIRAAFFVLEHTFGH